MELTTSEDVHAVCLFRTLDDALSFGEFVESRRFPIKNNPDIFGKQLIVDENDEVCGFIGVQQADEENVGFIEYESTAGYTKRYFVLVEIYDKNDLNTSTSMLLEVDDLDIVYSLINSARPAK